MREYFINADFDLSLRRRRSPSTVDARTRQAGELPFQMVLLGIDGDSVLVPHAVAGDFFDYLRRLEIPPPAVSVLPSITERAAFSPFGWNDEACRLNSRYANPVPHPTLDVIRRVNGRSFAAEIEGRHWGGHHLVGSFRSVAELEETIGGRPAHEDGWLVKSEHGNGGFGNRRLRSRRLSTADRETVVRLLAEDDGVVVEVWRHRVVDLATAFWLDKTGVASRHRTYEVINTADGALIGDIFDQDSPAVKRWGSEVQTAMVAVAKELAGAGYFGPVCVDSFVWEHDGVEKLRPVVDINARLYMAAAAERLWRTWDGDRVVYWRLFSTRKLRLPETLCGLEEALRDDAFDPRTRQGVLVTSPMEVDGRRLRRLGVLLAGVDRAAVDRLDRRFREHFER